MRTRIRDSLEYGGAPDDEVLGDERSWWRSLTGRQLFWCAVVAAVAVALVVSGHFGSRTPKAAPTPQVSNSNANVNTFFRPLNLDDIALHCPSTIRCSARETVPDATIAAVQQYLPDAFERRTLSIDRVDPNGLYYRAVNATSGLVELLIIVSVPESERGAQTVALDPHPGAAIRYARVDVGPYEVQVQYTGPPGGTPALDLAQRLAADPRLLSDN